MADLPDFSRYLDTLVPDWRSNFRAWKRTAEKLRVVEEEGEASKYLSAVLRWQKELELRDQEILLPNHLQTRHTRKRRLLVFENLSVSLQSDKKTKKDANKNVSDAKKDSNQETKLESQVIGPTKAYDSPVGPPFAQSSTKDTVKPELDTGAGVVVEVVDGVKKDDLKKTDSTTETDKSKETQTGKSQAIDKLDLKSKTSLTIVAPADKLPGEDDTVVQWNAQTWTKGSRFGFNAMPRAAFLPQQKKALDILAFPNREHEGTGSKGSTSGKSLANIFGTTAGVDENQSEDGSRERLSRASTFGATPRSERAISLERVSTMLRDNLKSNDLKLGDLKGISPMSTLNRSSGGGTAAMSKERGSIAENTGSWKNLTRPSKKSLADMDDIFGVAPGAAQHPETKPDPTPKISAPDGRISTRPLDFKTSSSLPIHSITMPVPSTRPRLTSSSSSKVVAALAGTGRGKKKGPAFDVSRNAPLLLERTWRGTSGQERRNAFESYLAEGETTGKKSRTWKCLCCGCLGVWKLVILTRVHFMVMFKGCAAKVWACFENLKQKFMDSLVGTVFSGRSVSSEKASSPPGSSPISTHHPLEDNIVIVDARGYSKKELNSRPQQESKKAVKADRQKMKLMEPQKRQTLLRGISGYCCGGQAVAVLGPSGAGKTSFLHSLRALLDDPPKKSIVKANATQRGKKKSTDDSTTGPASTDDKQKLDIASASPETDTSKPDAIKLSCGVELTTGRATLLEFERPENVVGDQAGITGFYACGHEPFTLENVVPPQHPGSTEPNAVDTGPQYLAAAAAEKKLEKKPIVSFLGRELLVDELLHGRATPRAILQCAARLNVEKRRRTRQRAEESAALAQLIDMSQKEEHHNASHTSGENELRLATQNSRDLSHSPHASSPVSVQTRTMSRNKEDDISIPGLKLAGPLLTVQPSGSMGPSARCTYEAATGAHTGAHVIAPHASHAIVAHNHLHDSDEIDDVDGVVDELLDALGLSEVADREVDPESFIAMPGSGGPGSGGLSTGERRRVLIALELLCEPDILLADELTQGLDPTLSFQVLYCVTMLARRRRVCLFVSLQTPSYKTLSQLFHNILVLDQNGRMVWFGNLAEGCAHIASATGFDPPLLGSVVEFMFDALSISHWLHRRYQRKRLQRAITRAFRKRTARRLEGEESATSRQSMGKGRKAEKDAKEDVAERSDEEGTLRKRKPMIEMVQRATQRAAMVKNKLMGRGNGISNTLVERMRKPGFTETKKMDEKEDPPSGTSSDDGTVSLSIASSFSSFRGSADAKDVHAKDQTSSSRQSSASSQHLVPSDSDVTPSHDNERNTVVDKSLRKAKQEALSAAAKNANGSPVDVAAKFRSLGLDAHLQSMLIRFLKPAPIIRSSWNGQPLLTSTDADVAVGSAAAAILPGVAHLVDTLDLSVHYEALTHSRKLDAYASPDPHTEIETREPEAHTINHAKGEGANGSTGTSSGNGIAIRPRMLAIITASASRGQFVSSMLFQMRILSLKMKHFVHESKSSSFILKLVLKRELSMWWNDPFFLKAMTAYVLFEGTWFAVSLLMPGGPFIQKLRKATPDSLDGTNVSMINVGTTNAGVDANASQIDPEMAAAQAEQVRAFAEATSTAVAAHLSGVFKGMLVLPYALNGPSLQSLSFEVRSRRLFGFNIWFLVHSISDVLWCGFVIIIAWITLILMLLFRAFILATMVNSRQRERERTIVPQVIWDALAGKRARTKGAGDQTRLETDNTFSNIQLIILMYSTLLLLVGLAGQGIVILTLKRLGFYVGSVSLVFSFLGVWSVWAMRQLVSDGNDSANTSSILVGTEVVSYLSLAGLEELPLVFIDFVTLTDLTRKGFVYEVFNTILGLGNVLEIDRSFSYVVEVLVVFILGTRIAWRGML